jgi:cAMP phosphodiesterase
MKPEKTMVYVRWKDSSIQVKVEMYEDEFGSPPILQSSGFLMRDREDEDFIIIGGDYNEDAETWRRSAQILRVNILEMKHLKMPVVGNSRQRPETTAARFTHADKEPLIKSATELAVNEIKKDKVESKKEGE